jgi:hypothetical protein
VARIDLRMNARGEFYVIEVNPLPGLTPNYSDLCLIATAANIDYRSLIGEILAGGLKRLREKRRNEAKEAEARDDRQLSLPGSRNANGSGNGQEKAPVEKTPPPVTTIVP